MNLDKKACKTCCLSNRHIEEFIWQALAHILVTATDPHCFFQNIVLEVCHVFGVQTDFNAEFCVERLPLFFIKQQQSLRSSRYSL